MPSCVTVFGGTGFLGRRIVCHLHDAGLVARVACRHPDAVPSLFSGDVSGLEAVHADVNDDGSVAKALAGAWAVVNTVSLYVERGKDTFHSVHVEAAKRVAVLARQAGAEILVHISGIGANAGSVSPYIRSRGEGEVAVLDAFPSAKLVRPAVMFGPDDAFPTPLLAILRRLPVFPMLAVEQLGCSRSMSRMSLTQSFAYCGRRPRHSFMSWPDHVSIPIKNC
jgi:NADH dehydrogenase